MYRINKFDIIIRKHAIEQPNRLYLFAFDPCRSMLQIVPRIVLKCDSSFSMVFGLQSKIQTNRNDLSYHQNSRKSVPKLILINDYCQIHSHTRKSIQLVHIDQLNRVIFITQQHLQMDLIAKNQLKCVNRIITITLGLK